MFYRDFQQKYFYFIQYILITKQKNTPSYYDKVENNTCNIAIFEYK